MHREVDRSPAQAASEVAELGSVVLRQAWNPTHLQQIRAAIDTYCERRLKRVSGGKINKSDRMYATHGVGTFVGIMAEGLIQPGILREMFIGSPFEAICREVFQDDVFYVSLNRLGFRNHHPSASDRSFIPYHQDSYTQDARTPKVLNCWMPLDPGAGRDAPGLEVVRNPCHPDFPRKDFGLRTENAAYDFITIDRDAIVEAYGETFLAPEFEIGDGLVFSENVIHRTYVTPGMTRPRINFEFRVFSRGSIVVDVAAGPVPNQFQVSA